MLQVWGLLQCVACRAGRSGTGWCRGLGRQLEPVNCAGCSRSAFWKLWAQAGWFFLVG